MENGRDLLAFSHLANAVQKHFYCVRYGRYLVPTRSDLLLVVDTTQREGLGRALRSFVDSCSQKE